jgi:hypothetical protein
LDAIWHRAPQRDSAVAIVIVVELAEWALVTHEEARLSVTHSFVHLGKGESNLANALEFRHASHIVRSGSPRDAGAPTRGPSA